MNTTSPTRYIVNGTDVHDSEAGQIAKFQHAGVAQIATDWLNTPEATPEDYEWVSPCAHAWCEDDHAEWTGNTSIHAKAYERGMVRFDFVVNEATNDIYISWVDNMEDRLDLDAVSSLSADVVYARAAFEEFLSEILRTKTDAGLVNA